jgi:hypothetical protein
MEPYIHVKVFMYVLWLFEVIARPSIFNIKFLYLELATILKYMPMLIFLSVMFFPLKYFSIKF